MTAPKSANHGTPYHVPPEPKPLPSFLLAVAVHAALLAFLAIGVSWQKVRPAGGRADDKQTCTMRREGAGGQAACLSFF